MTVKTEAYQIGVSNTASQNFHLTAAAADGTMQLYRGNPGAPIGAALLSIDANGNVTLRPSATVTPAANGDLQVQLTSNTALAFKVRGSDGVVRTGTLTLS